MLGAPQGCLHANALILLACQVVVMLGCVWNAVVQRIKGARSAPEDSSIYIYVCVGWEVVSQCVSV